MSVNIATRQEILPRAKWWWLALALLLLLAGWLYLCGHIVSLPFVAHDDESHQGTMLPALRLITIVACMLLIVVVATLGAIMLNPLSGLTAKAVRAVNPRGVERAHWASQDGCLTLFALLALWLVLDRLCPATPLYDPETWPRLLSPAGGDRLIISEISVDASAP